MWENFGKFFPYSYIPLDLKLFKIKKKLCFLQFCDEFWDYGEKLTDVDQTHQNYQNFSKFSEISEHKLIFFVTFKNYLYPVSKRSKFL